jgi:hypothetical protein
MDTPMLGRPDGPRLAGLRGTGEVGAVPRRLGRAEEYAHLAATMIRNGYLDGETGPLDGAIHMAPR